MKGDEKVIEYLNGVLRNELTAINQYMLHGRMLKNWGINKIADYMYKESIDEMKHAEIVIDRILLLDGLPNLQDLKKLRIGENIKEMYECDIALEYEAVAYLKEGINHCEAVRDYVTRDIFVKIQEEEEHHIDWMEAQFYLIENAGLENYISDNMHEDEA